LLQRIDRLKAFKILICVKLFTIVNMLVVSQYIESCYVVSGCIYKSQERELSVLWAQSLFVAHPVWRWSSCTKCKVHIWRSSFIV